MKRYAVIVGLMLGLILSAVLQPRDARPFSVTQPPGSLLEGSGVCAGPPTAGNFAFFTGTQWCDGVPNNTAVKMNNAAGTPTGVILLDAANHLTFGDGTNPVVIAAGSAFRPSTTGIAWNNGGDPTEIHRPEGAATLFQSGSNNTLSAVVAPGWVPQATVHATALAYGAETQAAGCTTSPKYCIATSGSCIIACTTLTLANGTQQAASSENCDITAPANIGIVLQTAGAGCTTLPANINFVISYTTN